MDSVTATILVGYDYDAEKDNAVLIVGKSEPCKPIEIINAFQGEEATALYKKLITMNNKKGE